MEDTKSFQDILALINSITEETGENTTQGNSHVKETIGSESFSKCSHRKHPNLYIGRKKLFGY